MKKRLQISSHWEVLRRELESVYWAYDNRFNLEITLSFQLLNRVQLSIKGNKWNN